MSRVKINFLQSIALFFTVRWHFELVRKFKSIMPLKSIISCHKFIRYCCCQNLLPCTIQVTFKIYHLLSRRCYIIILLLRSKQIDFCEQCTGCAMHHIHINRWKSMWKMFKHRVIYGNFDGTTCKSDDFW